MLFTKLKIRELKNTPHSPRKMAKRLNTVGYVQNVRVDLEKRTVSFEYATHRDMDSVIGELRKMGLTSFIVRSGQAGAKRRQSENHL